MKQRFRRIAGWQGYRTDLYDLQERLRCRGDATHPVNYALTLVGCVMTTESEALVRTVIEAYQSAPAAAARTLP